MLNRDYKEMLSLLLGNIEDLLIPVISRQNLIINKLATGRDKDKIDAENLMNS